MTTGYGNRAYFNLIHVVDGAFAHFIVGSVAERVVRTAPCPVLTVRDTSRVADVLAAERVSAFATG